MAEEKNYRGCRERKNPEYCEEEYAETKGPVSGNPEAEGIRNPGSEGIRNPEAEVSRIPESEISRNPEAEEGRKHRGTDLPGRTARWIREQRMLCPGDHVIVGLSGGADSVCLLLLLNLLKAEFGITLSAVHVNHGIRGAEAEEDEDFCRRLCERRGIPLSVYHWDVPALAAREHLSCEEAGRKVRYQSFREEKKNSGKCRVLIAVAHHMDDEAETVLLNLCRGTGIRGAGGMAPVHGDVIRPLLHCRRREIVRWLEEQGENWKEDRTNREDAYTRNRIRHGLLPVMEEQINAGTTVHLAEFARQAREIDRYLDQEAERWIRKYIEEEPECRIRNHIGEEPERWIRNHIGEEPKDREICEGKTGDPGLAEEIPVTDIAGLAEEIPVTDIAGLAVEVPAADLAGLPEALEMRILHILLSRLAGGAKDLTAEHLRIVMDMAAERTAGSRGCDLPGGIRCERIYGKLRLRKCRRPQAAESVCVSDGECPDRMEASLAAGLRTSGGGRLTGVLISPELPGWKLHFEIFPRKRETDFPENRYTKWFDYDKLKQTMRMRKRGAGDRISLAGVGSKTVRRYMIDARIPAEERDSVPILAEAEQVLWIVGYRISENYKVTADTVTILQVTAERDEGASER